MTPGKRRFSYSWVVLAACLVIFVTSSGIRLSFGVFFKSLEDDFGWTRAVTSGVFSLSSLLGSIFTVGAGWILDRHGPRAILTGMGLCTAVGLLLSSMASTLAHFYLSYSLLLAAGTGAVYLVVTSTVARWFGKGRGLAIGIVTSGMGLGTLIVPSVSAYLISDYGWRTSFLIMALVAFLFMTPFAQLVRRTPDEAAALRKDEKGQPAPRAPSEGSGRGLSGGYSLLQALRSRNLWVLFVIWFFCSFTTFVVMAHIVRHGIDLGFTSEEASFVLSLIGAASIAGRLIAGRVSDSIGRKHMAAICAFFLAGTMLYVIKASTLLTLYVFAVVFGFCYGGAIPPIGALIAETFGLRHLGAILGVIEVGWAAGSAAGPAFAGYVFDTSGNYVFAFLAGSLVMLITVGLVYLVRPQAGVESRG